LERWSDMASDLARIVFGTKIDHPKVWIMQRLIFLLILTLLLIKPTANAIFLSKVGVSKLPIAYLMIAVLALFFTLFYNRYISRLSPLTIFHSSIRWCMIALVVIGGVLLIDPLEVVGAYLFYLFISVFGILSASQFWILANQIFNAREARKYFGFIGFGAIAGGIAGGYLASLVSTLIQSEAIPFFAAFILLFVMRIIKSFSLDTPHRGDVLFSEVVAAPIKSPFRLILDSKHLTFIALVIAISVFTSKLIDFQFGYFASQAFPVEEELTAFYGIMFSTFNLVAITIQVVLTTRIIGRLGIGYSLVLLPVILVLNAGALLLVPGLIVAAGLKLSDASMKQSINKAATELIMLPVPKDIKLRTKTFLDVFIDSIATGFSGIVLLLVLRAFDFSNWIITSIILAASIIWFLLTNKIRREYMKVFRKSLYLTAEEGDTEVKTIMDSYIQILRDGSDDQILKALAFLQDNPLPSLDEACLQLFNHSNPLVVRSAIEVLMYSRSDYSDHITPLLETKDQNINIVAFEYLINHQHRFDPNFLIDRLNSKDPEIKVIAIVAYAREFRNDPRLLNTLRIEDRIRAVIEQLAFEEDSDTQYWIGVLKAIGYGKFTALYAYIDRFLVSDNEALGHHAILAAGETRASKYLKILLAMLDTSNPRIDVVKSIAKFSMSRIEKAVQACMNKDELTILRNIPKILEIKPSQKSVMLLQSFFSHEDIEIRNNAISSLRVLSDTYPLLRIDGSIINEALIEECKYTNQVLEGLVLQHGTMGGKSNLNGESALIRLLKAKIDTNLKLIFELLHIKYPPENYLELFDYVNGSDTELRNNAIEYVDNSLTFDLKSAVIPLLEYTQTKEISRAKILDERNAAKIKQFLVQNKDEAIREAAVRHFEMLKT